MLCFDITKKYAFEMSGLNKMCYFGEKPPLANLNVRLAYGKKYDHSPRVELYFELFGYTVIDMSVYNIFHAEDSE